LRVVFVPDRLASMSAVWGWQYLQVFLGVILPDGFQNLVRISTELMLVLFDSKEK
jgi:hypothetical protein